MAIRTILRIKDVERASGHKKSQIYRLVADGLFPRPVRISKQSVGWFSDEVLAWQQARERTEGGFRPSDRRKRHEAA